MTATADLPEIRRGDDWEHTLRFWTDASKTTPLVLTGRTYTAQLRQSPESEVAADLEVDATDLATGVIVLTLAHADTADLPARSYVWDLQEVASGVVTTLLAGRVHVAKDVTRP